MWNIKKWKMKNSCLISKQNVAISPAKSKMRWLTLNELLNASDLRLSLMKFQVCCNFILLFVLKNVIEYPEEIFKTLSSVTIY